MVGMMIATALALEGVALYATAFAINFAVSTIVTKMFGVDQQGPQDSGTREQVPPSNTNAIPIVYGDAYLGGTFVDAVLSTDQKCMYYVMAVSCISPNGQFTFDTTDMYYGDRKITFDKVDKAKVVSLTDEANNEDTKINGRLYIGLYTSSPTGVITNINWFSPSVVMGSSFGGFSIDPSLVWPASGRQMNGLAFAIVRLEYDQNAETTSLQPITFKVKQALYATGVAKPGDVWYDYITNKQYGGGVGWMPDGTFDSSFVDSASALALSVYSDELITYTPYTGGTSTQARYRINGVIDAGQPVISNLDKIMSCCDSWMTYNAASGKWAVVINKAESATYSFNDNNIIGEVRVSATDITQSINQVEAKFPNKGARDQPDFVNLKTPDILLYPNEPVNKYSVSYDLVNDSVQAQYLANRILEQAREDLIVSFSTTYYGIQVDAGNVVSVTNSDYGWTNKLFRVVKVNEASLPDGSLGARLEMTEYNAQVYDDASITQFTPVSNSGLPSVYYFSTLSAPTVAGYPSASYPHFDVTVTVPATGRVTWINLYYTTSATPTAADWSLLDSTISSNSRPITNGTSYIFANLALAAGTYYFAFTTGNDIGSSALSAASTAFVWAPVANTGPFADISGVTSFTRSSTGTYTPTSATLSAVIQNITSPTYSWAITGGTPTSSTLSSITVTPNVSASNVVAQLTVNGSNLTSPIVRSTTMAIIDVAPKNATANLYQWATTTPGNPSGTSIYTWATGANSSYTGGNGWQTTVPSNPGTPLIQLWVASKAVSADSNVSTTSVSWTSGYSVGAVSQNGANGVQTATAIVYQWATTIPTIAGTSTYTWATGAVSFPPSGWYTTISDSPAAGLTLWAAKVSVIDSVTATTTSVNWTTASIVPFGYVGSTGAVARLAYTATTLTLNSTPSSYTVTGDNVPANDSWGTGIVWSTTTPTLSAGQQLWQTDGVYNPTNNQTIWGVPYLSALKVGNLSSVSSNTGNLTVSGTITVGANGYIAGGQTAYNTGTGFFLGYSGGTYKFSIGSSTVNMLWDGSSFTVNGAAIVGSTISGGQLKSFGTNYVEIGTSSSGNLMFINAPTQSIGAPLVLWSDTAASTSYPFFSISTNSRQGGSDNAAISFTSSATNAVGLIVNQIGSSGGAGIFYNIPASKQFWVAPGLYSAYSPSGGGKIYVVDGNGPFTGFHDMLIDINSNVSVGDIVVDQSLFYKADISNTLFIGAMSSSANQTRVLGVVSNVAPIVQGTPGSLWKQTAVYTDEGVVQTWAMPPGYDAETIEAEYKSLQVNALGEGQINVCGQNGNISAGDYIVTSATPGKGMKQDDDVIHNYTVAKARESVVFDTPDQVKMIACIYLGG